MALAARRLPENVRGDLYVDDSCIDCDTCRTLAPDTFGDSGRGTARVRAQPRTPDEHRRARMALVSCPTASIGSVSKVEVRAAARALPVPIDGLPEIYFCGYASPDSYGATAYLIRRPDGNVLVDSPRAARPLLERIDELGGVALMFLTHRDDVADHRVFHRRYGCRRILHADDVSADTRDVELQPRGRDPVRLADDLLVIPVPGHTRGSAALLYKNEVLFTGDHLWHEDRRGRPPGSPASASPTPLGRRCAPATRGWVEEGIPPEGNDASQPEPITFGPRTVQNNWAAGFAYDPCGYFHHQFGEVQPPENCGL